MISKFRELSAKSLVVLSLVATSCSNDLSENSFENEKATALNELSANRNKINGCDGKPERKNKEYTTFVSIGDIPNSIYVGAILNPESIIEGEPTDVPIFDDKRNSITVRIDGQSGVPFKTEREVKAPRPAKIGDAVNEILHKFYEDGSALPGEFEVSIEEVHGTEQLQAALDIGYSGPVNKFSSSLGVELKSDQTAVAVKLKQKFYSVSVTPKLGLIGEDGWYSNKLGKKEVVRLMKKYAGTKDPVYVNKVTYGCLYSLVYQSSSSAADLKAALNYAYKGAVAGVDASLKAKYKTTLENTEVTVKQIGGNSSDAFKTVLFAHSKKIDEIVNSLSNHLDPGKNNPGEIIGYETKKISDNKVHSINTTYNSVKKGRCQKIVIDPTTLYYDGGDHGTGGSEFYGDFIVEELDVETGNWDPISNRLKWGFGNDVNIKRDHFTYGEKHEYTNGNDLVFDITKEEGKRFRIVSTLGECDDDCPNETQYIVYEYVAKQDKWLEHKSNNAIGKSRNNRNTNKLGYVQKDDDNYVCTIKFDTYILNQETNNQ